LFSSILGFGGSLITPNYTVTKNCMRAIAESLRFPLKKYGISISYVCPGGVKTGMTSVLPKWLTCFFITAETAAKMIISGCEHGDYLIVFPFSCYSICYGFLSGPAFLRESLEAVLNLVYRGLFDHEI
jgi:short-subunit dehydrogenase